MKQHIGEVTIGEFEVTFVVKLEQRRAVRMFGLQMDVVYLRLVRRVATFLAHVHLPSTVLLVN